MYSKIYVLKKVKTTYNLKWREYFVRTVMERILYEATTMSVSRTLLTDDVGGKLSLQATKMSASY
jgi:hypothetical protein